MKAIRTFVTLLAVTGVAYACGDDITGGGTTIEDLAGSYTASQFAYSDPSGTFPTVDLVALGGAASVNLSADGAFTGSLTLPGAAAAPFSGTVSISGSTLTLTVSDTLNLGLIVLTPDDPTVFNSFTLSGNQLTLSATGLDFDFTLGMCGAPPCPESPANLVLILNR